MGVNAALAVVLAHSLIKLRPNTAPPAIPGIILAQNEYESFQVCQCVHAYVPLLCNFHGTNVQHVWKQPSTGIHAITCDRASRSHVHVESSI